MKELLRVTNVKLPKNSQPTFQVSETRQRRLKSETAILRAPARHGYSHRRIQAPLLGSVIRVAMNRVITGQR